MQIKEREIILKNGKQAVLKTLQPEQAAEFLNLERLCTQETDFLIRYPQECPGTVEEEEERIRSWYESETTVMIVCEIDHTLAGNCQLSFRNHEKIRHRGTVGISVLKKYWNMGIGTQMFLFLKEYALSLKLTQLELSYTEGNDRGRRLYEKQGFRITGQQPDAVRLQDGTMLREYSMTCPICPPDEADRKKKVYFAGSIRGGRDDAALYHRMIVRIQEKAVVLTEHVGLASLGKEGQQNLADTEIYRQDTSWLRESDFVIAECSSPSLGVGYELAYAEKCSKPVYIFYRSGIRLSAMLTGDDYYQIIPYESEEELMRELDRVLAEEEKV